MSVAAEPYSIEADGELPLTVSLEPSGGLSGVWVGETGPGTSDEKLSSGLPVGPRTLEYEFAGRSGPGQGSPGASAIAIRKALRINGIDSGYAHIRVSARSLLSISIDELSRALTANGRRAAATQIAYGSSQDGFIGLEELRRQGFDIRFDARADRIVLDL